MRSIRATQLQWEVHVQCRLQCTYMTHSPRCQHVMSPPRTHSLTHINCSSHVVICSVHVAKPVSKHCSISDIVPDFYCEGFPFQKQCYSTVASMAWNFSNSASYPEARARQRMCTCQFSQTFRTISSRVSVENARLRADVGSVPSVLAAAVSVGVGEQHRRLSVRPARSACAAPLRANGSPLQRKAACSMMGRVCAPPCCQAVTRRQLRDGRGDVRALAAPEWWRERRHLCRFPPC